MGAAETHPLAEHSHKRTTRAGAHSASFIVQAVCLVTVLISYWVHLRVIEHPR